MQYCFLFIKETILRTPLKEHFQADFAEKKHDL